MNRIIVGILGILVIGLVSCTPAQLKQLADTLPVGTNKVPSSNSAQSQTPTVSIFEAIPSHNLVVLNWTITGNVKLIQIRRSTSEVPTSPDSGALIGTVTLNAIVSGTVTDNDVIASTRYYYALFPSDDSGKYSISPRTLITQTLARPLNPTVIDFKVVPSAEFMAITWTVGDDTRQITIRRSTEGFPQTPAEGDLVTASATPGLAVGSLIDREVSGTRNYYYSAFATDANGDVSTVSAHVQATLLKRKVSNLELASLNNSFNYGLSWNNADLASGDSVEVRMSATQDIKSIDDGEFVATASSSPVTVNLIRVEQATTLNFGVFVRSAAGGLGSSAQYHFYFSANFASILVFPKSNSSCTVSLYTRALPKYVKSYQVVMNDDHFPNTPLDGTTVLFDTTNLSDPSEVVTGLDPNKTYYFRLFSTDRHDRPIETSAADSDLRYSFTN